MPAALITVAIVAALLLLVFIFRAGVRADGDKARRRAEDDERRRAGIPRPDWDLMAEAGAWGIQLDIPADTVTVEGQATGSFTGSLARVETYGQINHRVTLTRVALIGLFALAAPKKQDDRELYLTIEGYGFQLAAQIPANAGLLAREFVAIYNTRSGVLTQTQRQPTDAPDTVRQLQSLAQLHADGALTDDEFTAAKARLLGDSQQDS